MDELIERLKKATGPDAETDALISALENGWTVLEIGQDKHTPFIRFARRDGSEFMVRSHDGKYTGCEYTRSVDFAMGLIQDGHYLERLGEEPGGWTAKISDKIDDRLSWEAIELATAATAISCAALEARAALKSAERTDP